MEIEELKLSSYIKSSLEKTWITFFGRFGRLTEIQIKTIPKVLEKKNVLVVSPTSTGKTEAIVAPLSELLIREGWNGLSIVYIVPTRALANDLYSRLKDPLKELNIKCDFKHSDKPRINYSDLPNLLITTPESLDSLICRHKDIFSNLRALVIDEIHYVDNTYRGDHLRILINRLQKLSMYKFNIYLLSATIANPVEVGKRYVSEFEIVNSYKGRDVDYVIVKNDIDLKNEILSRNIKKILVFCNYRETTEMIYSNLKNLFKYYYVFVHHGSLNKKVREEAEEYFKESRYSICIATSTLEVGIDIGDIDCVVLYEIPWSLFSFIQRIGRGNRRENVIFSIAKASNEEEVHFIEQLYNAAKVGVLPREEYYPDYSVVVQQVFSVLYENRSGLRLEELYELLNPICDLSLLNKILDYLVDQSYVYKSFDRFKLSTFIRDLGEKGKIHSNIPDSLEYEVIEKTSGKRIGKISGYIDEYFVLGGIPLRVVEINDYKRQIWVEKVKGNFEAPIFKRKKNIGAFFGYLPNEVKEEMLKRTFR